jgi:hypothetical protein
MTRTLRIAVLSLCALLLVAGPAAAKPKKSLKLSRGATTLTLDKGAVDALTSLGIAAAPLAPATADGADLKFPITTGRVNKKTLAGTIRHSGGLSLTRGTTRVELRNFVIDTKKAVLTARVGNARLAILDLDLSKIQVTMKGKRLKVSGVSATLTKGAADALNSAFATTAFKKGLLIGTAVVKTRATPRR